MRRLKARVATERIAAIKDGRLVVAWEVCKMRLGSFVNYIFSKETVRMLLQTPRHGKPLCRELQQAEKELLLLCGAEVGEMNGTKQWGSSVAKWSPATAGRNEAERMTNGWVKWRNLPQAQGNEITSCFIFCSNHWKGGGVLWLFIGAVGKERLQTKSNSI